MITRMPEQDIDGEMTGEEQAIEGQDAEEAEPTEPERFDIKQAMDTDGFLEFLEECAKKERFDPNDPEAIESRFNAFQNSPETARDMAPVIERELAGQGLDVKFDVEGLSVRVRERIMEMAHEDPERMNGIHACIQEYRESIRMAQEAEQGLSEMTDRGLIERTIAALEDKEETLMDASEVAGFFSRNLVAFGAAYERFAFGRDVRKKQEWLETHPGEPVTAETRSQMEEYVETFTEAQRLEAARTKVQNEYMIEVNPENIEIALHYVRTDMEKLKGQLSTIDALQKQRLDATQLFEETRAFLLADVGMNEAIREMARVSVMDRMDELMRSDPDGAMAFFEHVESVSNHNMLGIDYFQGEEGEFEERIDQLIEEKTRQDLEEAIGKMRLDNSPATNALSVLEKFVDKQKLGSKTRKEARAFVIGTIKGIAGKLPPKSAKAMLLTVVLARLPKA